MSAHKRILITGITGFLGTHIAIQLLEKGYEVIGTLRYLSKESALHSIISAQTHNFEKLHFIEIDLLDNVEKWVSAMSGIDAVMHVASPFPSVMPKDENDLIEPAKKGTLTVLEAATRASVKRVVVTSSIGAVVYGENKVGQFTERNWTQEDNYDDTTAYFRSKTIAEKAAWKYVNETNGAPELVTILPGAILGPIFSKDAGTSVQIVKKLLDGSTPAIPNIGFEMVDVRSVADMHIKALEMNKAAGKRYICTAEYLDFKQVTQILKSHYPNRRIPSFVLPDFAVKLFSFVDPSVKAALNDLGTKRTTDNSLAKKELGWEPIPMAQSIIDCAESLLENRLIK